MRLPGMISMGEAVKELDSFAFIKAQLVDYIEQLKQKYNVDVDTTLRSTRCFLNIRGNAIDNTYRLVVEWGGGIALERIGLYVYCDSNPKTDIGRSISMKLCGHKCRFKITDMDQELSVKEQYAELFNAFKQEADYHTACIISTAYVNHA